MDAGAPVLAARLAGQRWVNVAALGLMLAVTWELARVVIVDPPTLALALISAVLLVRFKVNPAWLIVGAATLGALLRPGS